MKKVMQKVLLFILVLVLFIGTLLLIRLFDKDHNAFTHSPYDSYTKQAKAWLEGRTDLGAEYPHLELAHYEGNIYVSFPPVPSIPLIPFVILFGENTPNNLLCWFYSIISFFAIYALFHRKKPATEAFIWAVLGTFGTNILYISAFGGVWHEAQTMSFMLCSLSVLGVTSKKPTHNLLGMMSWALAVGCRPFVACGFPMLFYILYRNVRVEGEGIRNIKKTLPYLILPMIIALALMWYNFIRFGNPFEFGHTYLNEFLNEGGKQFELRYIPQNLQNIFRLPYLSDLGWPVQFTIFNAFMFYLVNPVILLFFGYSIYEILHGNKKLALLALFCILCNFTLTLLHKTLGGFQFGARYFIDMIPFMLLFLYMQNSKAGKLEYALCILGIVFNVYGMLYVLNPAR